MILLAFFGSCVTGCGAKSDYSPGRAQHPRYKSTPGHTLERVPPEDAPKILPQTHFAAGLMFEKQGMIGKAIEQYRKAVAVNHEFAAAYHRLGRSLSLAGKHDEAVASMVRAMELRPNVAAYRNDLGFELMYVGQWDASETHLRRAIELDPEMTRAHVNLGLVLSRIGRFEEALMSFKNAMPDMDAHYNLGLMYRGQGRFEDAAAEFERVLAMDSGFTAAKTQLEQVEVKVAEARTAEAQDRVAAIAAPPDEAAPSEVEPSLTDGAEATRTIEAAPSGAMTDAGADEFDRLIEAIIESAKIQPSTAIADQVVAAPEEPCAQDEIAERPSRRTDEPYVEAQESIEPDPASPTPTPGQSVEGATQTPPGGIAEQPSWRTDELFVEMEPELFVEVEPNLVVNPTDEHEEYLEDDDRMVADPCDEPEMFVEDEMPSAIEAEEFIEDLIVVEEVAMGLGGPITTDDQGFAAPPQPLTSNVPPLTPPAEIEWNGTLVTLRELAEILDNESRCVMHREIESDRAASAESGHASVADAPDSLVADEHRTDTANATEPNVRNAPQRSSFARSRRDSRSSHPGLDAQLIARVVDLRARVSAFDTAARLTELEHRLDLVRNELRCRDEAGMATVEETALPSSPTQAPSKENASGNTVPGAPIDIPGPAFPSSDGARLTPSWDQLPAAPCETTLVDFQFVADVGPNADALIGPPVFMDSIFEETKLAPVEERSASDSDWRSRFASLDTLVAITTNEIHCWRQVDADSELAYSPVDLSVDWTESLDNHAEASLTVDDALLQLDAMFVPHSAPFLGSPAVPSRATSPKPE